jgi:hypothetical protein
MRADAGASIDASCSAIKLVSGSADPAVWKPDARTCGASAAEVGSGGGDPAGGREYASAAEPRLACLGSTL